MSQFWIAPDRIFDGQTLLDGMSLRIVAGAVAEIGPAPADATRIKGCLTPGYVDLQVNGGGGVMLNTTPTRDGMAQIAAAHRQFGTVAVMPTVITDHPDVMDQAAEAAIAAHGDEGIVGLHIEGPHIAKVRRGTHDGRFVRPLDDRTMHVVTRLRTAGVPVMITLAPETVSAAQIAALTELGVIVSIGHTDATADQVEAAIAAGVSCATHLFNAMSPMATRAPGTAGAVLNAEIYAGIICDGHHVDDRMVQLALRGRPLPDRLFLVSDAMSTVGGPDHFDLYGQPVHLKNGKLINSEGGLAGAHVTQAEAVQRLVQVLGVEPERALRMAITTPAAAMGLPDLAVLVGRPLTDILQLADDMQVLGNLADIATGPSTVDAAE